MEIKITQLTPRSLALDAARWTVDKALTSKEPSSDWWRRMLRARHSPIRSVIYRVMIYDIEQHCATHLCRHHVGVEKYVASRRTDRSDKGRQAPTNIMLDLNAEAMMTVSQKRLCFKASKETWKIWRRVVDELETCDPVLASMCYPACVVLGGCPELVPCGIDLSRERKRYYDM
jgi:hypothetical protein